MKRVVTLFICTSVLLVLAGTARAGGNDAAAEALFVEAKKLAAEGRYAEACPKFAESNRLDRAAGTLIHLGDCQEKNRQTASAWATFKEAASAAQALGRKDWEKLATTRAAALEARLSRITITCEAVADRSVVVTRNGMVVAPASFGVAIPVDAGEHVVEATMPGKKPFKAVANIDKDGENVTIAIPSFSEAEAPDATLPSSRSSSPVPTPREEAGGAVGRSTSSPPSQRTLGLVVGGVGVAGIAVGAVTGLLAMSKSGEAKDACPNDGPCASRAAVDASESASSMGLVSTVGFLAGGALLAGGAVLFFTSKKESAPPRSASASFRIVPDAGPNGSAGVTLLGGF
jgi:hypothetical protein